MYFRTLCICSQGEQDRSQLSFQFWVPFLPFQNQASPKTLLQTSPDVLYQLGAPHNIFLRHALWFLFSNPGYFTFLSNTHCAHILTHNPLKELSEPEENVFSFFLASFFSIPTAKWQIVFFQNWISPFGTQPLKWSNTISQLYLNLNLLCLLQGVTPALFIFKSCSGSAAAQEQISPEQNRCTFFLVTFLFSEQLFNLVNEKSVEKQTLVFKNAGSITSQKITWPSNHGVLFTLSCWNIIIITILLHFIIHFEGILWMCRHQVSPIMPGAAQYRSKKNGQEQYTG